MNRSATCGRQRALSQHGPAAGHGPSRTGDITAFVRSQQYVHRCEFGGLARLAKGCVSPKFATFSSGMVAGISGVQIGPGATLFTRIPFSPNSCAKLAEKFAMAALVAAYGASVGEGISEFTDELPITDDPGPICGKAALTR
jgi:hypothetical protein